MKNPCMAAALHELEAHGVRDIKIERGSKHPRVLFRVNGGPEHTIVLPGSPSDWRSPHNTKREVRILLRELGVITTPEPKPAPPPRKLDRVTLLEQRVKALELALAGFPPATVKQGDTYDRRSDTL